MGAPAKTTGGKTTTTRPGIRPMSAAGSAPERPPRGRSGGGGSGDVRVNSPAESAGDLTLTSESARPKLPKPPQGHAGYEQKIERKLPRRDGTPPRYSNQSAKQDMIEAAIAAASERGYEAMRISEITDPIGVTRQAFYAHFRDKRHCICEAIDPKLGAIERMAASLNESDPAAAARIAHTLDDLIVERFGSEEGTRGRIVGAMISLLRETGSFHKVRIGALVKAAHVPPGDFYRQFSGKGECFAVAYGQLLDDLIAEVRAQFADPSGGSAEPRHEVPALLERLAAALSSDPERRRILIVDMAHLPDDAPAEIQGARKDALRFAIARLLAELEDVSAADPRVAFAVASIIEVIRSAELSGEVASLSQQLPGIAVGVCRALTAEGPSHSPARLSRAA